jgi:DNA/RNA-binding domain of Phe-tRNA-synthetase-like protein
MSNEIHIDSERLPAARLLAFTGRVKLSASSGADINGVADDLDADNAIKIYKSQLRSYGRDPNRYRISSDALRRRITREGSISAIHPLVNAGNAISLGTGWPVGCYNIDAIRGTVNLRIGDDGESVETLAKGWLDISRLPVLSDEIGFFGSPVSDSLRTRILPGTIYAQYYLFYYGEIDILVTRNLIRVLCAKHDVEIEETPMVIE